jgi:hypothetical protein
MSKYRLFSSLNEAFNDTDFCYALDSNDIEKAYDMLVGRCITDFTRLLLKEEGTAFLQNTTDIPSRAFTGITELEFLFIPNNVQTIGNIAFCECSNLKEVVLPDSVDLVGWRAFDRCVKLREIRLSKNLKEISNGMFSSCYALKEIIIPYGVEKIGEGAFQWCSNLTHLAIPASVHKIGNDAFHKADSLTYIDYRGTMEQWKEIDINWATLPSSNIERIECSDGTITLEY